MEKRDDNSIADIIRKVYEGDETVFDLQPADPDTDSPARLEITRQRLPDKPEPELPLARSPKRDHVFSTIDGFSRYITEYQTENTVIFGDPIENVAYCVIDERAKNGFEIVKYEPTFHPRFKDWDAKFNRWIDVLSFAEFVMQRRVDVTGIDGQADTKAGRQLALIFSQLTVSSQVMVNKGQGLKALNGVVIETKITGSQSQSQVVQLPENINLKLPVFLLDEPIELDVDVSIKAATKGSDDGVLIMLSCSELKSQVAQKFINEIKSMDDDGAIDAAITFGRPCHDSWQTI